jgi:hypothetical protein
VLLLQRTEAVLLPASDLVLLPEPAAAALL